MMTLQHLKSQDTCKPVYMSVFASNDIKRVSKDVYQPIETEMQVRPDTTVACELLGTELHVPWGRLLHCHVMAFCAVPATGVAASDFASAFASATVKSICCRSVLRSSLNSLRS